MTARKATAKEEADPCGMTTRKAKAKATATAMATAMAMAKATTDYYGMTAKKSQRQGNRRSSRWTIKGPDGGDVF
jgi:hypothetical protein